MKKLITGVAIVFGFIMPSTFTFAAPPDDTFVVGFQPIQKVWNQHK